MFEPLQKFIKRAARKYGVAAELEAAGICQNFRDLIPGIFKGKETPEQHIQPAYFKNNILAINVENSAWAQEVIIRKEKIITEMNQKAGEQVIKNLRTLLKRKTP